VVSAPLLCFLLQRQISARRARGVSR
jgi:hypothetical protein